MSVLGFPEELNFQSLKSMYPSRKTEYRKAPMNSQTFTAVGQDIQLVLPKMENSFYDPNTICVNFTVDYSGITAGAVRTNFLLYWAVLILILVAKLLDLLVNNLLKPLIILHC